MAKLTIKLAVFFDEAKIGCFWYPRRGHGLLYGAIFGLLVPATRPKMGIFGLVKKKRRMTVELWPFGGSIFDQFSVILN